jgi:phytoene desaturase
MRLHVIGAGLGGLAVAIRLARAGHQVEVFEKKGYAGGKLCELRVAAREGVFRFEGGPTLLTEPALVDELFALCGEQRHDELALHRCEPAGRAFFPDGSVIDQDAAFWQRADVASYLEQGERLYRIASPTLFAHPLGEFWRGLDRAALAALWRPPRALTARSLADLDARHFADPRLRWLFDRYATFNGSAPARTPAAFAAIAAVQARHGSWYPVGGMARLAEALQRLAERQGVRFRFGVEVTDLLASDADAVVCNADVITAHQRWLPRDRASADHEARTPSASLVLLWLGVRRRFPQLAQHNVFFGDDPDREYAEVFDRGELPTSPTVYLHAGPPADEHDAPAGCHSWTLQVLAPARTDLTTTGYRRVVLDRLRRFGLDLDDEDLACQRHFAPRNFAARDNAWRGALYGWASHGARASFARPPLRHPRHDRLYFVGGTVHPGGGIPLVLRGAAIVSALIARDARSA